MTTSTKQANKVADIRYIVTLKNQPGIQVYKVMASNGVDMYDVRVCHNHVSSCSCAATRRCYHMATVEAKIAESLDSRYDKPITEVSQKGHLHSARPFSLLK